MAAAEDVSFRKLMSEPLVDSVKLGNFELAKPGDSRKFELPRFPQQNGKIPVLRFRMVSFMPKSSGCNYSTVITVSGMDLGPVTAANESRMVGKRPIFEMKSSYKGRPFAYWGGKNAEICVPFGPDWETVDLDSVDGAATAFILDLSDVLSPVDGNAVTFRNIRNHIDGVPLKVMVKDCEVGYLDQSKLQKLSSSQIPVEPLKIARTRGNCKLEVGTSGGFAYGSGNAPKLIVESRLSSNLNAPWSVLASDTRKSGDIVSVANRDFGRYGVETEIRFSKDVILTRRLTISSDGLLQWREV